MTKTKNKTTKTKINKERKEGRKEGSKEGGLGLQLSCVSCRTQLDSPSTQVKRWVCWCMLAIPVLGTQRQLRPWGLLPDGLFCEPRLLVRSPWLNKPRWREVLVLAYAYLSIHVHIRARKYIHEPACTSKKLERRKQQALICTFFLVGRVLFFPSCCTLNIPGPWTPIS